jgi:hypothetical protein
MEHTLPPEVYQLLEQLKSPDSGQRLSAAAGLAGLDCRDESVRRALEDAARDDPDTFVMAQARYALVQLGFPKPEPTDKSLWKPEVEPVPQRPAVASAVEPYQAPAVSGVNEPVQGDVRSNNESRWQKYWPLLLGIPVLLLMITCAGLFFLYIQKSLAEVQAMGPWPAPTVEPEYLVDLDLSAFGLELDKVMNARYEEWASGGSYQKGAYATYKAGNTPVVAIWALRYPDRKTASRDYSSMKETVSSCGAWKTANLGNRGIIFCGFSNGYSKLWWNDQWIISIDATSETRYLPATLVDKVRDAMAAHWHELPVSGP